MKNRNIIMVSAGVALCAALSPYAVSAAEMNGLQAAGVTAVLETRLTTEQYIEMAEQAQGAAWGYTNLGIADVEGELNVREQPGTEAKVVGRMARDAVCEVLAEEDGWAHIRSGKVEGYVSAEYLMTGLDAILRAGELVQTVAVVNASGLNVREEPDIRSKVLALKSSGAELEYLETLDGWVKVLIDGQEAYVSAEYVTVEDRLQTALTMTEILYGVGVSDVRVELVEFAKQFLGNPYVWGGSSLTNGTDCSGFTMSVYRHFGVKLPHYTNSQAECGTEITASELRPGDIIFYANDSGVINHVSLYIGNGQVIHASNPKTGIKISQYNYRTPVKYVKILQD